jgi:hypothetical protein
MILGRKEERKEQASTDGDGAKENLDECPAGTTSERRRRIQQERRVVVLSAVTNDVWNTK